MQRSTHTYALIFAGLLLGLQGCSDEALTPAGPTPGDAVLSQSVVPANDPVDPIARGIALALADPALRRQVLEDMRDSPFPKHKLHLKSYLRGERGRAIAAAAAPAARMKVEQFLASVATLPELEFSVRRPLDRARWAGTGDVVVVGTTASTREIASARSLTGYNIRGEAVSIPLSDTHVPQPLLTITPTQTDFGADPEARRRAAPKRSRNTISTLEEEFTTLSECDPETAVLECPVEPGVGGGPGFTGLYLSSEYTWNNCTTNLDSDQDRDGIRDQCESEIAYRFRPYLQVSGHDDNLGREPYWAVKKTSSGSFVIFYALAYYRDGGENTSGVSAHIGDSEFIVLTVVSDNPDVSHWKLLSAYLSAHWDTWQDDSEFVGYNNLEYPDTYRGRPRIWVAEEKHANYKSQSTCAAGGLWFTDVCYRNDRTEEIQVRSDANIGNSYRASPAAIPMKDCVYSIYRPSVWTECFWSEDRLYFFGWHAPDLNQADAKAYRIMLSAFEF